MAEPRTQRLRDPVHGLIVFRKDNERDQLAWQLINTPEFQRLRRIKQLGVSDFVYPSATHTRFSHSIGVFHTARKLIDVIHREIEEKDINQDRENVATIAALLHDIGHGPFSHTFEGVQKLRGLAKKHEIWTAEIIENKEGEIFSLLKQFRNDGGFGKDVADLLRAENPKDIYHAVVSSSFDADRLDYLQRDRLMTGTKAGAIDFDWLIEHIRVRKINLAADDDDIEGDDDTLKALTFCIDIKALPAAEQFLLARYTLHEQVYFHKTTRCIEHMISRLLYKVSMLSKNKNNVKNKTGLKNDHHLVKFFSSENPTVQEYLALDDILLLSSFEEMRLANDADIKELAIRIKDRKLYKTLDIRALGEDEGAQIAMARKIDAKFPIEEGLALKDEGASLSIYSKIGGDDERAHKKLHILDFTGQTKEISEISDLIKALADKQRLTRYYFRQELDREKAKNMKPRK